MSGVRAADSVEPGYLMGHSDGEITCLRLQADMLAPITRRLLYEAGLRPGMRAVDIGCGTGDVAVMMADIVGANGSVIGIDRSDVAIRTSRGLHAGKGAHLRFEIMTLDDLRPLPPFDFAFGRYVLMHQDDPAAMIRAAAAILKPGGTIAVHEIVLLDGFPTAPRSPLW